MSSLYVSIFIVCVLFFRFRDSAHAGALHAAGRGATHGEGVTAGIRRSLRFTQHFPSNDSPVRRRGRDDGDGDDKRRGRLQLLNVAFLFLWYSPNALGFCFSSSPPSLSLLFNNSFHSLAQFSFSLLLWFYSF